MRLACLLFGCALLLIPAYGQRPVAGSSTLSQQSHVSFTATVEAIEFRNVSAAVRNAVLDRIGVRAGDVLTADARQRIGRGLRSVQSGMTFTFLAGSRPGTARVVVSGDC